MASEAVDGDSSSLLPLVQDVLIDGLAQGCSIPEAAMLCGFAPEQGMRLLEQPDVRQALRNSLARLAEVVRLMDLAAYYAQPPDSNVVDLWAWHALRRPDRAS